MSSFLPTSGKFLATHIVANRCGVTRRTVARWIRDGYLVGHRAGLRVYRVAESDLAAFIESTQRKQSS